MWTRDGPHVTLVFPQTHVRIFSHVSFDHMAANAHMHWTYVWRTIYIIHKINLSFSLPVWNSLMLVPISEECFNSWGNSAHIYEIGCVQINDIHYARSHPSLYINHLFLQAYKNNSHNSFSIIKLVSLQ